VKTFVLLTVAATLPIVFAALGSACADPVHEAEVSALGPEAPGVPRGPTHRAGQPCLTCHGGLGPGDPTFVTAGTIYVAAYGSDAGAGALNGGTVTMTDSTGSTYVATTNAVGNFYVTGDEWNPVFPIGGQPGDAGGGPRAIVIGPAPACTAGTTTPLCPAEHMLTAIGRGGVYASCAYCHFDPPGPSSPGHIYQNPNL
jgi:hypothetical protein